MQIAMAIVTLATIGAATWVKHIGVAQAERTLARWLLADARARDARDAEFAAARVALAEVR